jgi:hypothetical protein
MRMIFIFIVGRLWHIRAMKQRSMRGGSWSFAAFVSAFALLGCSDSAEIIEPAPEPPVDEPEPPAADPVYVAFVGVPTDDGVTSYVTTLSALDGSELSLDRAIEIPGSRGNRMYVYGSSVFVGEGESQSIVRYDLTEDGELRPGQRMSLSQLGATPGNVNLFASDELAYLVDQWGPAGLQIVKWNPSTMETIGTLDIADVASDDYLDFDVQSATRWGKYFAIPYSLKNWDDYEVDPSSTVLLLDPETDETEVISASGCSYTTSAVAAEDGDLYLASSSFAYLFKQFDPELPTNCVARVRAGELTIDETYSLDLNSATDGRDTGDLAYGSAGTGYSLAFYPEETAEFDPEEPFAIFDANAWRPWAVDLDGDSSQALDFPLSAAALGMTTIEDRPYRLLGLADGSTEAYEVLDDGTTRLALVAPGSLYVLARVR